MDDLSQLTGIDLALAKLGQWSADFYLLLPNLMAGFLILLIFIIASYLIRHGLKSYFNRRDRIDLGNILSALIFWFFIVLGIMVVMTIVTPSIRPGDLVSGLGIGSLAIGFAFKDILQNWLAGLLILLRLPFRRGDQIIVGASEGTVVSIEPRATVIKTYDGRIIVIPNTDVYTSHVVVSTAFKLRRIELDITVGYDYNTNDIIKIILDSIAPLDEVMKDPAPQVLCWSLGATSMEMKIRWWVESSRAQEVISRARIVQAIKEAFELNDIDPTDPQLIFYKEHKAETEPEAKQNKSSQVKKAQIPQKIHMGTDDPETEDVKLDDRSQTILP